MQINFENNHSSGFKAAFLGESRYTRFRSLAIVGKMLTADSAVATYNMWAVAYSEDRGRWADVLLGHVTTITHADNDDDTVGELCSASNKTTLGALEAQLAKYTVKTVASKIPDPISCIAIVGSARAEALMGVGGEIVGEVPIAGSEGFDLTVDLMPALRNLHT